MNTKAVNQKDATVLRELAKRYMEIAQLDIMAERKQLWKDLHDLKPQRAMVIFEPYWLDGYMADYKVQCEDPLLRNVETKMMFSIRQHEQMDDDVRTRLDADLDTFDFVFTNPPFGANKQIDDYQ